MIPVESVREVRDLAADMAIANLDLDLPDASAACGIIHDRLDAIIP